MSCLYPNPQNRTGGVVLLVKTLIATLDELSSIPDQWKERTNSFKLSPTHMGCGVHPFPENK